MEQFHTRLNIVDEGEIQAKERVDEVRQRDTRIQDLETQVLEAQAEAQKGEIQAKARENRIQNLKERVDELLKERTVRLQQLEDEVRQRETRIQDLEVQVLKGQAETQKHEIELKSRLYNVTRGGMYLVRLPYKVDRKGDRTNDHLIVAKLGIYKAGSNRPEDHIQFHAGRKTDLGFDPAKAKAMDINYDQREEDSIRQLLGPGIKQARLGTVTQTRGQETDKRSPQPSAAFMKEVFGVTYAIGPTEIIVMSLNMFKRIQNGFTAKILPSNIDVFATRVDDYLKRGDAVSNEDFTVTLKPVKGKTAVLTFGR
jgi:hypothetical protein